MVNEQKLTPGWQLIHLLWVYRKSLVFINGFVVIIAIIISLFLPRWYEGRVVFIVNAESDLSENLASSVLGNVGLPAGLFGGKGLITEQYVNFLKSRTILDKIDSLYNLQQEYEIEYRTIFYKQILKNAQFIDNGDNTITIKFFYKEDPQKAAVIANSFYQELDSLVNRLKKEKNRKIRMFLESSYDTTFTQLNVAEEKLSQFQTGSKLYLPEKQTELMIKSIGGLETEKISLEIQKVYLSNLGLDKSSEYDALLKKLQAVNNSIKSLKEGNKDYDLALKDLPEKGLEYVRLYREVKVREKILEFIIPRLENARLEEYRHSSNLQLLDSAIPQDYKAKPKRSVFVFVFVFLSVILSVLAILVKEFIQNNSDRIKTIFPNIAK